MSDMLKESLIKSEQFSVQVVRSTRAEGAAEGSQGRAHCAPPLECARFTERALKRATE